MSENSLHPNSGRRFQNLGDSPNELVETPLPGHTLGFSVSVSLGTGLSNLSNILNKSVSPISLGDQ